MIKGWNVNEPGEELRPARFETCLVPGVFLTADAE
ncbi:UNVERIFIED_ORG: hypothetical protein GGI57_004562 [Rhizobium aethiopicum]